MIEILIKLVSITFLMSLAFVIGYGCWRLIEIPMRKWRESTFDYVYVDDDGHARELDPVEKEYVTTTIFPDDDAELYIKPRYESLDSEGRLRGYLRRRQLPRKVPVSSASAPLQSE